MDEELKDVVEEEVEEVEDEEVEEEDEEQFLQVIVPKQKLTLLRVSLLTINV